MGWLLKMLKKLPDGLLEWALLGFVPLTCFFTGYACGEGSRQSEIDLLRKDLSASRVAADAWKLTADQARAGQTALAEQAQACLDREAAAQADADQWRAILAEMQTRDLSDAEKTGVPDDATRRALFESLDHPL